jgi:hypothetical protein
MKSMKSLQITWNSCYWMYVTPRFQVISGDFNWFQLISGDFRWLQVISGDFKWFQVISSDFGDFGWFPWFWWFRVISSDFKWFHWFHVTSSDFTIWDQFVHWYSKSLEITWNHLKSSEITWNHLKSQKSRNQKSVCSPLLERVKWMNGFKGLKWIKGPKRVNGIKRREGIKGDDSYIWFVRPGELNFLSTSHLLNVVLNTFEI